MGEAGEGGVDLRESLALVEGERKEGGSDEGWSQNREAAAAPLALSPALPALPARKLLPNSALPASSAIFRRSRTAPFSSPSPSPPFPPPSLSSALAAEVASEG